MTSGSTITIREATGKQRRFPIEKTVILVGRASDNDLTLADPRVSRHHARLEKQRDGLSFRNLAKSNPVFLNGNRANTGRMQAGDVLQLGDSHLLIEHAVAPGTTPTGVALPADPADSLTETVYGGSVERARLSLLSEIVDVLPRDEEPEEFLERVLKALFRNIDLRRAFVALRAEEGGSVRMVAGRNREDEGEPVKVNRRFLSGVIESGDGLLATMAMSDPTVDASEDDGTLRVICVPIFGSTEVIGVLYGDNRERARSFLAEDMRFMALIGRILSILLQNMKLYRNLRQENTRLRRILESEESLVGSSSAMNQILSVARRVAGTDATILITGETGTGKSLLARTIHRLSPRAEMPFEVVSCAAIPDNLLEAELFGFGPKSGIAGANPEGREGYFQVAGEGTILLDEIGDMNLPLQAKILHAIEERQIRRLGANEVHAVRCRIVAATNQDLDKAVRVGRFREDLYYRLRVVPIHIPPLRERPEDIIPIAHNLLGRLAPDRKIQIGPDARSMLLSHSWPGNARELRNTLARALALGAERRLDPGVIRESLEQEAVAPMAAIPTLDEVQRRHILHVLKLFAGNKKRAAEALDISRSTLYSRLQEP